MEVDYETDDNFNFRLFTKILSPYETPLSHINYKFHIQFKISQFVQTQDSTFERHLDFSTVVSTRVTVHRFYFFTKPLTKLYEETRAAITRALSDVPLFDQDMLDVLIEHAWIEAWRGHIRYFKTLCCCSNLELRFLVQVGANLVLKYEEGCCSICLDDLFRHDDGGGKEVVCTPCQHVFHEDCIKNWWITTSSCPVCRFQIDLELGDCFPDF